MPPALSNGFLLEQRATFLQRLERKIRINEWYYRESAVMWGWPRNDIKDILSNETCLQCHTYTKLSHHRQVWFTAYPVSAVTLKPLTPWRMFQWSKDMPPFCPFFPRILCCKPSFHGGACFFGGDVTGNIKKKDTILHYNQLLSALGASPLPSAI